MIFIKRLRSIILFSICLFGANSTMMAQVDSVAIREIMLFRTQINISYKDSAESPLLKEDLMQFSSLAFFPIDLSYRVMAKLYKDTSSVSFDMKTSTARKPKYRKYGDLEFVIKNQTFRIPVYQNSELTQKPEYQDYLFFPFTDLTNENETYGGGRYLDLKIPLTDNLILDFNQCYQPYCAYNHKYSCPIPPSENFINFPIKAGVKQGFLN